MNSFVLSLFPGIGLLDMAFEEEGFCVVRGPDLLWGGDIKRFHPPAGKFDGAIGGPPCQAFSRLRYLIEHNGHKIRFPDLIPEFARCVIEARPQWFLMENVPAASDPVVTDYSVEKLRLNNRWVGGPIGAEQHRERHFWFGSRAGLRLSPHIEWATLESPTWSHAVVRDARAVPVAPLAGGIPKQQIPGRFTVLAGHGPAPGQRRSVSNGARVRNEVTGQVMPLSQMCELQGLPPDFLDHMPFTVHGKRSVLGNGVPLPMGRAVAKAVRRALEGKQ